MSFGFGVCSTIVKTGMHALGLDVLKKREQMRIS